MPLTMKSLKDDLQINEASLHSTIADLKELNRYNARTQVVLALALLDSAMSLIAAAQVHLRDE